MADNSTNCINEDGTYGFFEPDSPMYGTLVIMGIVTTIVGVLFGVGAMMKCACVCPDYRSFLPFRHGNL